MVSLPIPERDTGVRYADLSMPDGRSMLEALQDRGVLQLKMGSGPIRLSDQTEAHLDPDLVAEALPRPEGFTAAFGQRGTPQREMNDCHVEAGDLFLFFGWFEPSADAKQLVGPIPSKGIHVIWGWLEIGARLPAAEAATLPELRRHPHVVVQDRGPLNTIYVAADHSTWAHGVPGYGTFRYQAELKLTAPNAPNRSEWQLPAALHWTRTRLSDRHCKPDAWTSLPTESLVRFKSQHPMLGRWQDMVIEANEGVEKWVKQLLATTEYVV